jgi:hypothetical protein
MLTRLAMPKTQTKTHRNDSVPVNKRQKAENEKDVRDARRALKEARKKGSVNWEQVKREVGI